MAPTAKLPSVNPDPDLFVGKKPVLELRTPADGPPSAAWWSEVRQAVRQGLSLRIACPSGYRARMIARRLVEWRRDMGGTWVVAQRKERVYVLMTRLER